MSVSVRREISGSIVYDRNRNGRGRIVGAIGGKEKKITRWGEEETATAHRQTESVLWRYLAATGYITFTYPPFPLLRNPFRSINSVT